MKTGRAKVRWAVSLAVALVAAGSEAAPAKWPGSAQGTAIDALLTKKYEVSGMIWDPFSKCYYLVSEGIVTRLSADGKTATHWQFVENKDDPFKSSRPDFEAVAVTGQSRFVYVGREYPPAIFEFDPESGRFTNRSWHLKMETTAASGMEGLTFVPNGYHPFAAGTSPEPGAGGGLFYASSQKNGHIYPFDVFKDAGHSSTDIAPIASSDFKPVKGESDIADLYFSTATRTLYVLYGKAREIVEVDGDTLQNDASYKTPDISKVAKENEGWEGITLIGNCPVGAKAPLALGNDVTGGASAFTDYPQHCAVALEDSGDATVSQKDPSVNYGGEASLRCEVVSDTTANTKNNFDALLQFTGELPAKVDSAKLMLYVTDETNNTPNLCAVPATWSESTVNWSTAPACIANTAVAGGKKGSRGEWVTYDVTSLVKAGHRSFRHNAVTTDDLVVNSKEATDHKPLLIVKPLP